MTLPFGMGNVTRHVQLHEPNYYGGDGLVGMMEIANDSDDDLLADDSLLGSDTRSCTGSHHPSLECFAMGTPDGYVEEAEDPPRHSRHCMPTSIPAPAQVGGGPVQPPPPPPSGRENGQQAVQWRAALIARQKELEEAQTQLEQERAELERELRWRFDGGCARAHASEVNRKIMEDR